MLEVSNLNELPNDILDQILHRYHVYLWEKRFRGFNVYLGPVRQLGTLNVGLKEFNQFKDPIHYRPPMTNDNIDSIIYIKQENDKNGAFSCQRLLLKCSKLLS